MAIEAELADGRVLEFPDGTDPLVIQATIKRMIAGGKAAQPKSGFLPALQAGWENLKGDVAGLAGRTGLMAIKDAEAQQARNKAEAARIYKPTEGTWFDSPGAKFAETLGGSVPYMAAPVVAGGAAAFAGAPALAAAGAAGLVSAGQFTGSNLSRQQDEGAKLADTDLTSAAAAAVPQALLDVVGFKMIPGIRRIFAAAGKELTPKAAAEIAKAGLKSTVADYAKSGVKASGVEGLTEAGQQVLERLQAGLALNDEAAREEYLQSFIGGAALGGALSVPGRFHERGREQLQAAQIEEQKQIKAEQDAAALQQQQEEQKQAQRQDPAYAQKITDRYNQLYAQHQAMLPGKLGAAATGADKLENEAQQAAADRFYEDNLKELEVEAAAVRPALKAIQEQKFQEAQEKAQATQVSDSGESYDAGQGAVQQMTAERDVLYQQQAAAVKQALEAAKKGDMATAKAAQEQTAQLLQRAKALEKQLGGRQVTSATTTPPPDNQQQIDRLTKQYGVAVQSGKMGQAEALRVELEKLHAAQKQRARLLEQPPTAWDEDAGVGEGLDPAAQAIKKQQAAAANKFDKNNKRVPGTGPVGPEGPAPTTSLYPQEQQTAPWRPRETPILDASINMRAQPRGDNGPREKYRKPGPDAQRAASAGNTAPAPETQQESLFPEIGPGGTLPGVTPETDLLQRIASLRMRPNMSTQGKQALDNFERTLSNPALPQAPTRENILDAIRDQLDRMANLGEGARQQVDTREGIKQVLADKQKELNAAREEAAALARIEPEKKAAPGTFQGTPTFAAARQKVQQLQQEMAALAQQLAQTTSKETVPVENRAVQPVWVPQNKAADVGRNAEIQQLQQQLRDIPQTQQETQRKLTELGRYQQGTPKANTLRKEMAALAAAEEAAQARLAEIEQQPATTGAGLTKAQQGAGPTQEQIAAQTPAKGGTLAPGYTKVGEVGYVNAEPGTQQKVSPVRTAASTATTDTVQGPGGSKMPTVSTSATVERRNRPNAESVRGKELTNAGEINEFSLDLTPEDQQSFDFWDSVYGVETPVYDLVRQAEGTLVRLETALGDAVARRNELARAQAAAERAEEDRNESLRQNEPEFIPNPAKITTGVGQLETQNEPDMIRNPRAGQPRVDSLPIQDEENAKAIAEATDKYKAAKAAAQDTSEVDAAQAALDEVENRVARLQDAKQYMALVHYLKTDPAATEKELDSALGTLTTLLSDPKRKSVAEEQARSALASLVGAESLTDADMQVYYKQRPAFEKVLGAYYADMFETVVRLKAALDVKARVDAFAKERAAATKKVQTAQQRQKEKVAAADTAQAAIPARASKLEVLEQRLAAAQAKEAELGQQAVAARKQLAEARRMRQDVIDSAEAMRAGKKSALEEQQEALRKDIERLSGDLKAVADSVVDIKDIVSQDFRNLLRYPGAMQDLEARFDFVTSVLEGLEAQGISSPRLETQQAGMIVATQRAERVKHERRVRTLELKRDWWKRVRDRAVEAQKEEGGAPMADFRAFLETLPADAAAKEKDSFEREARQLARQLRIPPPIEKAVREATLALRETEAAIEAENADYRARTADTPGDLLRNSAGMRNARAAESFIREQRQQLNDAYEQLTDRVRQIQQLTVPANRAEERGQLTRTAEVPTGTPAAPNTGAAPDYADMQRKRGLLVALSAIDLKEQAKLDAAIDAAARKTEEARAEYHRNPGNAMPASYYDALSAYDKAVKAKRDYMDARAAADGIETRKMQLAREIDALPVPEYKQLVEAEAAGVPVEQPSVGLASVARQLALQVPQMSPRRSSVEEQVEDAAAAARANDPKNVAFQERINGIADIGALKKVQGSLENQIADAVAARDKDPGEVVPLPVRSPLKSTLFGRPSSGRANARLKLNEAKVAGLQYRLDMVNARLDELQAARKEQRAAEPKERELQGNAFEVFAAEMALRDGRRGQGPVVAPEKIAGDMRTGSAESRAGDNKTGTRRRVQESGQVRQPTATRAMREGNAASLSGNRAAQERAKAEAEQAAQERLDRQEEKRAAAEAKRAARGRPIPEQKGEQFGADYDGLPGLAPATATDLSTALADDVRDGRIMDAVDRLASEGSTPAVQAAARKLKPFLLRTKLRTQAGLMHKGERVAGMYYQDTNTAVLDTDSMSEETLLHELTHAATSRALRTPDADLTPEQVAAKREIEGMFKALKGRKDLTDEYGLTDVDEFVAEVYSNPEFQAKLDKIGTPRTLMDRFIDAVRRLFGFGPRDPAGAKMRDAIEKIMMPSQVRKGGAALPAAKKSSPYAVASVFAQPRSFKDRLGGNLALAAEMHSVDMRAPLREALASGNKRLAEQAMYYVRKNDARMPQVYSVMQHGALGLKQDARGRYVVEAGNSKSVQDVFKAIAALPGKDAQDKMTTAQAYLTAKRALANPRAAFALDLGKGGLTPEVLAADMRKLTADPKQKEALENIARVYADLNRGLIKFLQETGAISKDEAAGYVSDDSYVPYYRVRADGVAELVFDETKTMRLGDIRTQPYLKALEGGDAQLLPLNEAITRNVMLLTDMGMRNLTTKNVAYALQDIGKPAKKMQIRTGDGEANVKAIRFKQDGKPYHIIVDTEGTPAEGIPGDMVARSLEGTYTVIPAFLKAFGWAGDVLRAGVTRNPMYVARQLFRDPFAASFTGGLDRGPLTAVAKAMAAFARQTAGRKDATAEALVRKGVVQSGIFSGDPDDLSKMSLQLVGGDSGAFNKLFSAMDRAAMRADSVTRQQLYDDVLKRTGSEMEAEMAAMEMMNFSKRGLSPTVQYASRMIPFFNAQIQGLNVLHKAITGKATMQERLGIQQKFWDRAGMLMAGTLIYAMAMEDDETYKNARASDRYANWFVPLSRNPDDPTKDVTLKLPIPFEVGLLFKAVPEALADYMRGTSSEQEWKAIRNLFLNQIPGGSSFMLPQLAKPLIEVGTNHSFFTGREIEGANMKGMDPQERYTARTTELAKRMSEMLQSDITPDFLRLSPLQIEHLARGYLGSLPIMAAATMNDIFGTPNAEAPTRKLTETPLVGTSFQDRYGNGAADILYAKIKAADQVQTTYNKMLNEGRKQDAKMYLADVENLREIPMLRQAESRLQLLAKQEKAIRSSDKLDADAKRERLDIIAARREQESRKYLDAVAAVAR